MTSRTFTFGTDPHCSASARFISRGRNPRPRRTPGTTIEHGLPGHNVHVSIRAEMAADDESQSRQCATLMQVVPE